MNRENGERAARVLRPIQGAEGADDAPAPAPYDEMDGPSGYSDAEHFAPPAEAVDERRGPRPQRPRRGQKRRVLGAIREIPNYLRLLGGLLVDPRVSKVDKALVGLAVAYVLSPVDLIPDVIPFLGQVDDVFLVLTALQRLITNAGARVVRAHWKGDPATVDELNVVRALSAASFFLPRKVRKQLRRMAA